MEKRLKQYLALMETLLSGLEKEDASDAADDRTHGSAGKQNLEELLKEHLIQIQFFQHERLIHLIVTCLFAVLAFAAFFVLFFTMNAGMFALFTALLVLLIPYIRHYYILENGVQRMYRQYDRLRGLMRGFH